MLTFNKGLPLRAALLAFSFVSTQAFAARVASVTGSLPRNLSDNNFTVQIVISEISEAEQTALTTAAADTSTSTISKRFEFRLNGNSTKVPFTEDSSSTINFYATEEQIPDEQQTTTGSNTTWTHTYTVRFNGMNTNSALSDLAGTSNSVTLKFKFLLSDDNELEEEITIKKDSYVIAATPDFLEIGGTEGSHKSVTVNFEIPSGDVDALGSAPKKPASHVSIWLVDSSIVTTAQLAGKIYSGSEAEDSATTCTLTLPGENLGECVRCDADKTYLDEIGQPPGILYRREPVKSGSTSFTGLVNNRRYFAFMQYEPDGITRTQCLVAIPSGNNTVTELNGAGEATVVDFRCFIATAAYGTPLHAKIGYFRKFRDEVLLHIPGGRTVVNLYYQISPPVADFIAERPKLKNFVRNILDIPASVLETVDQYY